ncbi:MAG: DNA-directed RNA polymerase subunit beta [Elusimicrobia bacterium]|nr:DNA-directed RNA polymerase subunit beta [Elusimicrobiota bacterium]
MSHKIKQLTFEKAIVSAKPPDLLELQKNSYANFLQEDVANKEKKLQGLQAAFMDIFPISNEDESLSLEFVEYSISKPRFATPKEAMLFDKSYTVPLRATLRLVHRQTTGKVKVISEQEVFLCDLPYMTESASFVINGAERVIVSQLHRSPGIFFEEDEEKKVSRFGKKLFIARVIPYRGAWIDFEFDLNNVLFARIDKRRKFPATVLLRVCGLEKDEDILAFFYSVKKYSIVKEPTLDHYAGRILAKDVVDPDSGEVVTEAGEPLTKEILAKIQKTKVHDLVLVEWDEKNSNVTMIETLKKDPIKSRKEALHFLYKYVRGQEFVIQQQAEELMENMFFGKKSKKYDLTHVGRYKIAKKLGPVFEYLESRKECNFKTPAQSKRELAPEDVVAAILYLTFLNDNVASWEHKGGVMPVLVDDIDHLGNRRVRAVGELLENQFRVALTQMARVIRERMVQAQEKSELTPRQLINASVLNGILRNFFGSSQLSQFMDQINPLAELTHKRRLSALGPGGLHRKHAGFEVRDVHHTHYGRICPIETPEGPNIGLITSLAFYARVNDLGLIESPYRKVEKGRLTDQVIYLTADEEDEAIIAQANTPIDDKGNLIGDVAACRYRGDFPVVDPKRVQYMDISPTQVFSVSTALIPFLEHDDANRALMGSNMQRQAVPLVNPEFPLVGTGVEAIIAKDSHAVATAKRAGRVVYVDAEQVVVNTGDSKNPLDVYSLTKYERSNQDTTVDYRPIVNRGDRVAQGDPLADGPSTCEGQLALGKNVLVAFMPWDGYNFEDAILASERLVRDDTFKSIHISEFEVEARETKLGPEEITRDIPNVSGEALGHLDEQGIAIVGTDVTHGDILVGRVIPRGEEHLTPEEKLLRVIFGKKAEDVQDASLRVPPGVAGKVIKVQVFVRREILGPKEKEKRRRELDDEIKAGQNLIDENESAALAMLEEKKKAGKVDAQHYREEKEAIDLLADRRKQDLNVYRDRERERINRGDEVAVTVNRVVKVYVATMRPLRVGDKLAGRHGNKGVVSKILPIEDMPRMPDGTPIDIVFSPLSIPSRMNVGQLLETMFGWAAKKFDAQVVTPVFNGANEAEMRQKTKEAREALMAKGVPEKYLPAEDLRVTLYDGRTGQAYLEKITIGYMYVLKLIHVVEDKIHARSTGPYSLITRQPLGGKALFGGQRLGEMEVWALEAYGAAHTLQEFLTIKSDDVWGRTKMYESIIRGEDPVRPGAPESFKVLVRELQGLGLAVELLKQETGAKEKSSKSDEASSRSASKEKEEAKA